MLYTAGVGVGIKIVPPHPMFTVVDSSRARLIKGSVFKVLDSQNLESILYNAGAIDGLTKVPQTQCLRLRILET